MPASTSRSCGRRSATASPSPSSPRCAPALTRSPPDRARTPAAGNTRRQPVNSLTMTHKGMTFGIFLAPFHRLGENPTLAMNRDMELIEWLDWLGYDEVWIGE